jgi:hypothetical protein
MDIKICGISMLSNEISIAPAFISHAKFFFDMRSFAVHNGTDGTFEELDKNFPGEVLPLEIDGHPQSSVMTKLMRGAFEFGADVVIPLDADEFLPFLDRSQLDDFLRSHQSVDVLQIPWRNFAPLAFPLSNDMDNLVSAHNYSTVHKTIVFRSAFLKNKNIALNQGNHSIESDVKLRESKELQHFLIHIPIRDPLQYAQKNIHGASSYISEKVHTLSDDWINGSLLPFPSESDLLQIALDYGGKKCQSDHETFKPIVTLPWMKNGFDLSKQTDSYIKVMRQDWHKLLLMYRNAGDGQTSEIELRIMKQRIRQFENSYFFRFIRKVERTLVFFKILPGYSKK